MKLMYLPDMEEITEGLKLLPGVKPSGIKILVKNIEELAVKEDRLNWSDTESWLHKLDDQAQRVANRLIGESRGIIRLRYLKRGVMKVLSSYNLIRSHEDEPYEITEQGRLFLERETGSAVKYFYDEEGLTTVLNQLEFKTNTTKQDLVDEWTQFCQMNSNVRSESVLLGTLGHRLQHLKARNFIRKEGSDFVITTEGKEFLRALNWEALSKDEPTLDRESVEVFDVAQHFIHCYSAARQGLKRMGLLRTERNMQGEYAEWLAAKLFKLELAENTIQKGYDATDLDGITYQVKSRIVETLNSPTSFNFKELDNSFDVLVGVFFTIDFKLLGIIKVPFEVVVELSTRTKTDYRFYWSKKVAGDDRIKKYLWTDEEES